MEILETLTRYRAKIKKESKSITCYYTLHVILEYFYIFLLNITRVEVEHI